MSKGSGPQPALPPLTLPRDMRSQGRQPVTQQGPPSVMGSLGVLPWGPHGQRCMGLHPDGDDISVAPWRMVLISQ